MPKLFLSTPPTSQDKISTPGTTTRKLPFCNKQFPVRPVTDPARTSSLTQDSITQLQSKIGNRATTQLLKRPHAMERNSNQVIQRVEVDVEGGKLKTEKGPYPEETVPRSELSIFRPSKHQWCRFNDLPSAKSKDYYKNNPAKMSILGKDDYDSAKVVDYTSTEVTIKQTGETDISTFTGVDRETVARPEDERVWTTTSAVTKTEGLAEARYRYEIEAKFTVLPGAPLPAGCEELGFLQVEKATTTGGASAHGSASPEQLERETPEHYAVDRTAKSNTPYYGLSKGETGSYDSAGNSTPWKSSASGTPAQMTDAPQGQKNWKAEFSTYVICIKGEARNTVYGKFEWGFDAKGEEADEGQKGKVQLTNASPAFEKIYQPPAHLQAAAKKWNEQVARRRNNGETVEPIDILK
jgi:hypothetical protein